MDELLGYFPSTILITAVAEHGFDVDFFFEAIDVTHELMFEFFCFFLFSPQRFGAAANDVFAMRLRLRFIFLTAVIISEIFGGVTILLYASLINFFTPLGEKGLFSKYCR